MVRLDREQVSYDAAFFRAELAAVFRIQLRLPQPRRYVAQVPNRVLDRLLPVGRHLPQLPRRSAHLLLLLRRETLHVFDPLEAPLPLIGRHLIQLPQAIGCVLLLLRRQLVKSLFLLEFLDLLLGGKSIVFLQPLAKVLLSWRVMLGIGLWTCSRRVG